MKSTNKDDLTPQITGGRDTRGRVFRSKYSGHVSSLSHSDRRPCLQVQVHGAVSVLSIGLLSHASHSQKKHSNIVAVLKNLAQLCFADFIHAVAAEG